MPTTVLDIIERSLRIIGVSERGENVTADEASDVFKVLNMLIGTWNSERLMVNGWVTDIFPLVAGKGTYTIGADGDFDTVRPFKIERAFARFNSQNPTLAYDYPLEIVPVGKYQDIFLKGIQTTYPTLLWYNPIFPLAEISLWPVPSSACQLGISQYGQINKFTSYTQEIELADGYDMALAYNLALDISAENGRALDPLVLKRAEETKSQIMRANSEMVYLKSDSALLHRKSFNVITGGYQ